MVGKVLWAGVLVTCVLSACGHLAARGTAGHGDFGGRKRTWVRFDPDQPAPGRRALVVALHGHGGTGEGMRKLSGLDKVAASKGFSVLYPDGLDHAWRDGRLPPDGVDDVAFLTGLIARELQTGLFDPARVYLTGMSNGAFMTHRMLCEHAELFAAAAPVAGGLSPPVLARCHPVVPVPIVLVNNTDDRLVPYGGGHVVDKSGDRGDVIATTEAVLAWQRFNHCRPGAGDAEASQSQVFDATKGDGTRAVILSFAEGCRAAPVVLARIEGGGHTWPGGWGYLPEFAIGKTSRAWNASTNMWSFFEDHRRVRP